MVANPPPTASGAPTAVTGVGSVPASLINWAAGALGISPAIVRAQVVEESGGNPSALSPAGAQGAFQFIPSTWASEGCGGSPWNVNDGAKCYVKYMYALLQQYHGNVRDALAAYNCGTANCAAGQQYADTILSAAGAPQGSTASGGTGPGSSAPGSGSTATLTASSTRCLVGGSGVIPCLLDASQARGIIGGACLLAGGVLFLGGVVLMVAIGAQKSGIAQALPGPAGAVARAGRNAAPPPAPEAPAPPKPPAARPAPSSRPVQATATTRRPAPPPRRAAAQAPPRKVVQGQVVRRREITA